MTRSGLLCTTSLSLATCPREVWASLGEATEDDPRLSGLICRGRLITAKPCCFWLLLSSACISDSLYSKAARLLDGSEQLVVQFVIMLVGRNVDPIKTGNTGGESIFKIVFWKMKTISAYSTRSKQVRTGATKTGKAAECSN